MSFHVWRDRSARRKLVLRQIMPKQDPKERLKFWITCPECGHKFGVDSDTVFKYVDRVLEDLTESFESAAEDFAEGDEEEGA